jgi:quercetin dioxygenase-like cupin family protein
VTDRLEFPEGSAYTFLERPEDPGKDPLIMEFEIAAGATAPPPHYHPNGQTETFEVTEGWFELLVDHDWQRVNAGESVDVPPGVRHTFRNESGAMARVRNVHAPAHDFEEYMRCLHSLASSTGATKPTNPVVAAKYIRLIKRFDTTIVLSDAPMRLAATAISGVAGLLRIEPPPPTA